MVIELLGGAWVMGGERTVPSVSKVWRVVADPLPCQPHTVTVSGVPLPRTCAKAKPVRQPRAPAGHVFGPEQELVESECLTHLAV